METDTCSRSKLSDLEYADDVVPLSRDSGMLWAFLARPNDSMDMFVMLIAPVKSKMLLQNSIGSMPNLVPADEQLDDVDRFS